MNTLYDQFQRCIRHPHQRIVGVCSSCLQERLISLIEPPSPPVEIRSGYGGDERARGLSINKQVNNPHENEHAAHKSQYVASHSNAIDVVAEIGPRSNGDVHVQQKTAISMHQASTSTMGTQSHDNMRNQRSQNGRHGHHPSCDFASRANCVDQNGRIGKHDNDALASLHVSLDKRNRGADAQDWQNRVSFREEEKKKGGGSWFSLSKSRNSSHATYIQSDDRSDSLRHALKSPRHSAASTRRSSDACRQVHVPDLQSIAEIDTKDASNKIQSHISRETGMGMSTSWISAFFHRRKSSRSRSNLSSSSSSSIQNAISDANSNNINPNEQTNHQNSIEAGRLSWDGARPNFKQLLKKIEARGKLQSQSDLSSPMQYVDYAMKEHNANGREAVNQAAFLQKSKSVASARSSISVEIPKDLMQSSFSPTIRQGQSNVMVGLEYDTFYDDRDLRRSRSWGRTWNRALSPLWGSRSHRHKSGNGPSSAHQRDYRHACTPVTPSHVNLRNATTSASSSHLSPLRRTKLAPTLKNLL